MTARTRPSRIEDHGPAWGWPIQRDQIERVEIRRLDADELASAMTPPRKPEPLPEDSLGEGTVIYMPRPTQSPAETERMLKALEDIYAPPVSTGLVRTVAILALAVVAVAALWMTGTIG